MTPQKVVKALEQIKTYCSANSLDELDCAIEVFKKLEQAGISDPEKADYSKLKQEK